MYMPGRRRTGSSPSSTVMSFAVYAASVIKKALQTGRLRAPRSLPDRAAGIGRGEARCNRICDDFTQLVVADPSNEGGRAGAVLRGRLDEPARRLGGRVRRRLGKRPRRKDEPRRGEVAELHQQL